MKLTKKEKWIKTEQDKAVKIHWDNIDRINKLKEEQSTKTDKNFFKYLPFITY